MSRQQYTARWVDSAIRINETRDAVAKMLRGNRKAGHKVSRSSDGFAIRWNGVEMVIEPRMTLRVLPRGRFQFVQAVQS